VTGKNSKQNEADLLDFLMSEEGAEKYKQILILIDHAKIDLDDAKS